MCKNIDGAVSDCAFKTHDLKCPKGHPLHLSNGRTFICCRSGCKYVEFVNADNIEQVQKQIKTKKARNNEKNS